MRKIPPEVRIGQIRKNNFGSLMEVVEYTDSTDMWVKFEHGNLVHTNWYDFCQGAIHNVYDAVTCGVGFIGEGKYKTCENGKMTRQYGIWHGMLRRCCDDKHKVKHPEYKECTVADIWHNFQNFATWYDENYYEVEGQKMHLDKDILIKGNKIYSPETCIFVPQKINGLFTKSNAKRGNFPIGVRNSRTLGKYTSRCLDGNKNEKYLGTFNTIIEAFQAYKSNKEQIIKQFAEEYKDKIPNKLYEVMINYEVEITD